jgi:nitroimidazol reductase NimA-like FMN-containing flavoprotein (pyridoxamine 5'-phosphate oxidase superfamily)
MQVDDPAVVDMFRRCMVVRIATLSRNGRPNITPIYFTYLNGHIWIGTVDWTLAARNARADPRVSLLFEAERDPRDRRVLRVTGRARVRTDPQAQRAYVFRVAFKYSLAPGGILDNLKHLGQARHMRRYHAQSAEKGLPCVIEVTPEDAEFV